ncbi:efflux RND transporter periplasmic adaptor subunit [Mangrovibacter plantisponsor]|uniref:RND family efflux transporter MFP subunit n=1 Tax=Mangrovibacter plantisponsor TaxID=451513 RepID=A0A317PU80_9ENTR|nr:HlyD family secretion protein [Mangrovibacter plantisponsor]PWW05768.1 RND family efflux transporter MFP subunit [Mangrovibacter plantisponsor]
MNLKTLKYFSGLLIFACAVVAGWMVWNYYMQSPWTRDGKVRAEKIGITPQVSGRIVALNVKDNQYVRAGSVLFRLDDTPWQIAKLDATAKLASAQAGLAKATREAARRHNLPANLLAGEEMDNANISVKTAQAGVNAAQAALDKANWEISQAIVSAPQDGWVTNLSTRVGDYATAGNAVFALVESHSFYVVGYFEETKLRHIQPGDPAKILLYSDDTPLQGRVASIGRAIYDQSVEADSGLIADIKPNVPWVRLAQRVPVRITLDTIPQGVTLVSGTTCTVAIEPQKR